MLFASFEFALFIPIVFILYWKVFGKNKHQQNVVLLITSYFFYGWWDWRFLILIFISTLTDYIVGIRLDQTRPDAIRKKWLWLSLIVNLGLLGFFKYYNFFIESTLALLDQLGVHSNVNTLNIILPIGISFYTFQTLAYTIDVYRGKIPAERKALVYFTYVSFFPQLLAGPIERASRLMPQFKKKRTFDLKMASDGMRQILWGLFCKIVIADTIGHQIDGLFARPESYSSILLIQGILFFAIQVYADFSGYSHIAIGVAKLFGIELMDNFLYPFFSKNLSEFWQRWHISLSTWFRDYVYVPLGGNRSGQFRYKLAIMVTFIISGLWHGASWNMVIWGGLNGLLFLVFFKFSSGSNEGTSVPKLKELFQMALTFLAFALPLVFFRSGSLDLTITYCNQIFSFSGGLGFINAPVTIIVGLMLSFEWIQKGKKHALDISEFPPLVRYSVYVSLILLISWNLQIDNPFIYFQF